MTHIDLGLVDLAIRADVADVHDEVSTLPDGRWGVGWGGGWEGRLGSGWFTEMQRTTKLRELLPVPSGDTKSGG